MAGSAAHLGKDCQRKDFISLELAGLFLLYQIIIFNHASSWIRQTPPVRAAHKTTYDTVLLKCSWFHSSNQLGGKAQSSLAEERKRSYRQCNRIYHYCHMDSTNVIISLPILCRWLSGLFRRSSLNLYCRSLTAGSWNRVMIPVLDGTEANALQRTF